MDARQLLEQMRAQRKRWVQLGGVRKVQYRVPTQLEVIKHFIKPKDDGEGVQLAADYEQVKQFVCGWDGFTEADLLGAANAPADAVAFDSQLWDLYVSDHLEDVRTVAAALLQSIADWQKASEADAKN
jgi:hypothetical protein